MGPVKMAEAFIANVAASEQKKIITISSGLGSIGDVGSEGLFAYRTSKAAVNLAMVALSLHEGMQTLMQHGLQRVRRGETTLEELARVARE